MEIKDIPKAVFNAEFKLRSFNKMIVSKIIEVIKPFKIASIIIYKTGKSILKYWKIPIVPKSPIEQPTKHQRVFTLDFFQVCRQFYKISKNQLIITNFTFFLWLIVYG